MICSVDVGVDNCRVVVLCFGRDVMATLGHSSPIWTYRANAHKMRHNNLSVDYNGIIWRERSTQSPLLQLLVPKSGREQLFLSYHCLEAIWAGTGYWYGWLIASIGRGWRMMSRTGSDSVSSV